MPVDYARKQNSVLVNEKLCVCSMGWRNQSLYTLETDYNPYQSTFCLFRQFCFTSALHRVGRCGDFLYFFYFYDAVETRYSKLENFPLVESLNLALPGRVVSHGDDECVIELLFLRDR